MSRTAIVEPTVPTINEPEPDLAFKTGPAARSSTSLNSFTPSERIASVITKIQETVQSPTTAFAPEEPATVTITNEKTGETHELSTEELRRQYEDEQVDRFLRVFSRVSLLYNRHPLNLTKLQQVKEVQMPEILPPEIPGKDDKDVPRDVDVSPQEAEDDEGGEEWRVDPGQSYIPTIISQTVSSPVAAVSNAASAVQESTMQAAHTIKENSNHTYTLINEGEWHGRSPAEWIAMVRLQHKLVTSS